MRGHIYRLKFEMIDYHLIFATWPDINEQSLSSTEAGIHDIYVWG